MRYETFFDSSLLEKWLTLERLALGEHCKINVLNFDAFEELTPPPLILKKLNELAIQERYSEYQI